jgi:hypothetical protein
MSKVKAKVKMALTRGPLLEATAIIHEKQIDPLDPSV